MGRRLRLCLQRELSRRKSCEKEDVVSKSSELLSRPTFLSALNFWENLQEHPLIVRPNEDSTSHAGTQPMEAAMVGQRAASPTPRTMSQLFLTTSMTTQANTQNDILPSALSTGHPTYTTADGGDPMDLQAPSGSGSTVKRTHQDPMFQKDIEKLEEPTKRVRATPGNPSSPYPTPSPSQSYQAPHQPEDDIDAQIEALSRELERLRRHKELVTARRQKTGTTLPTSVNLGWIRHLRSTYPGVPILVGGDFNAPHREWGYQYNTRRGDQVRNTMIDAAFTLLNQPRVSTCIASTTARTHAPDLTWWIGPGVPQWRAEPDTWGSDHMPIKIGLHSACLKNIRRRVTVTHWDKLREVSATMIPTDPTDSFEIRSSLRRWMKTNHNQTLPFYSYGQSAGRQTWLRLGTQLRRVVDLVSTILRLKRAATKNSFPDNGGMSGVIVLGPVLEISRG
ncbi:hypothetical protein HPB47_014246 [Ixodes persulcatus]|uniref:Uncharacterized protein n=1 Tax=Ixodes persulcatus TaxID=34615 RepID=A0AC60QWF7_IXOPE|nr:hypothetical protein HPB47_014246 [Ixodes persulcatus]